MAGRAFCWNKFHESDNQLSAVSLNKFNHPKRNKLQIIISWYCDASVY